jgi:tRNA 2-thiouridine synthesizing protein E
MAPGMRLLLKALATELGPDWGTSRRLYRLFPEGPAKQACRYAGLPKPVSCI